MYYKIDIDINTKFKESKQMEIKVVMFFFHPLVGHFMYPLDSRLMFLPWRLQNQTVFSLLMIFKQEKGNLMLSICEHCRLYFEAVWEMRD